MLSTFTVVSKFHCDLIFVHEANKRKIFIRRLFDVGTYFVLFYLVCKSCTKILVPVPFVEILRVMYEYKNGLVVSGFSSFFRCKFWFLKLSQFFGGRNFYILDHMHRERSTCPTSTTPSKPSWPRRALPRPRRAPLAASQRRGKSRLTPHQPAGEVVEGAWLSRHLAPRWRYQLRPLGTHLGHE
jgi:hypothetical protein